MADGDLQSFQKQIGQLPFKVKRQLATAIGQEAERLAAAIKAKAPVRTGALRNSVKVRRRRNDLDLEVVAGGDATTKYYDRSTGYQREVVIDGRSNEGIARGGKGVSYDYARAVEFGTVEHPAEPFFYNTARAMEQEIHDNIQDAVAEALK